MLGGSGSGGAGDAKTVHSEVQLLTLDSLDKRKRKEVEEQRWQALGGKPTPPERHHIRIAKGIKRAQLERDTRRHRVERHLGIATGATPHAHRRAAAHAAARAEQNADPSTRGLRASSVGRERRDGSLRVSRADIARVQSMSKAGKRR